MLETASYPPPADYAAADTPFSAPTRTRKIAILGFGDTVSDAPIDDPSWDIWAMNGFWRAAEADHGIKAPEERYSLWFDTHTIEWTRQYGKAAGFGDAQERWLEKPHPFPILMLDESPAFPSVRRYPVEDVVAKLGRDYFTSTVAYALALAISQDDVAEISLWGIDLTHNTEYAQQRPCAEYWIGRADGLGIKVTTHEDSALMKQRFRYGCEPADDLCAQLKGAIRKQIDVASKAIDKSKAEMEHLRNQSHTDDGARQAMFVMLERLEEYSRGGRI